MLILISNPSHSLFIRPRPSLSPDIPLKQLFAEGPIEVQVLRVQGSEVRLGVKVPIGFCIEDEELRSRRAINTLPEGVRWRLARKLKVLMLLNHHSTHSLALATGLAPAQVLAAENGVGTVMLDDLEKIAEVLGVKVAELFLSPGRTAAERWVLGLLEGNGCL